MFKEIRAKFDVVGLLPNSKRTYHYHFVIERKKSGAFKYGDHSCHILTIYEDNKQVREDYFDTRYEHISTYKPSWVKTWKNYIKRNWIDVQSVDLIEYSEEEKEN